MIAELRFLLTLLSVWLIYFSLRGLRDVWQKHRRVDPHATPCCFLTCRIVCLVLGLVLLSLRIWMHLYHPVPSFP